MSSRFINTTDIPLFKDEQMIIDQYQDELDKVGVHLEHWRS